MYIYISVYHLSTATGFRNNPTAEKKTPVLILTYPKNVPGLFPQAACDTVTNKHRPKSMSIPALFRVVRSQPNLVGGIPTPLKNMASSVGMMTFPI